MIDELRRIGDSRGRLLLDYPWFGVLSLRLMLEAGVTPTMDCNGSRIRCNPVWTARQTDRQLESLIAHETLHCGLLHPYRMQGKDFKDWNKACDYSINPMLREAGLPLWDGALIDTARWPIGTDADTIYAALRREAQEQQQGQQQAPQQQAPGQQQSLGQQQQQGQQGQGQEQEQPTISPAPAPQAGQPGQPGEMDAPAWQIAAEEMRLRARKAGKMAGGTDRAILQSRATRADWRSELAEFAAQLFPSDYSWARPNRRFIWQGLYLPGVVRDGTARLGCGLDCSGSIRPRELDLLGTALQEVMQQVRPEALDVAYFDATVQGSERFTPEDGVKLHPRGGGGTKFQPVLDWFSEHPDGPPTGVLMLTDLDAPQPQEPDYPVLWITPQSVRRVGWFGRTIRLAWED